MDSASTFFSAVLGWTFEAFEGFGYRYSRIQTGSEEEMRIDGSIGEIQDAG